MAGVGQFSGQTVITRVKPAPALPPSDPSCLDRPLYKFLRTEHAAALMENGTIRVGTLWEYQNEERHGTQVGDEGEGRLAQYDDRQLVLSDDPTTQSAITKQVFNLEGATGAVIQGITMAVEETVDNLHVYSLSGQFDRASFAEFADSRYEICLRIDNPSGFVSVLDAAMKRRFEADNYTVLPCVYGNRVVHYRDGQKIHPVQLKPIRLAHQHEVRVIWRAPRGLPEPHVFDCPELSKFFSVHDHA
jgi:hypothetical protein